MARVSRVASEIAAAAVGQLLSAGSSGPVPRGPVARKRSLDEVWGGPSPEDAQQALAQLIVRALEEDPHVQELLGWAARGDLDPVGVIREVSEAVAGAVEKEQSRFRAPLVGSAVAQALSTQFSRVDRLVAARTELDAGSGSRERLARADEVLQRLLLRVENTRRGWMGSGFAVGDLAILTAAHVAEGADVLTVAFGQGRGAAEAQAKVVFSDPGNDLAVLRPVRAAEWERLHAAGLSTEGAVLSLGEVPAGHWVLCEGYHAHPLESGAHFVSPCPVVARVARLRAVREVEVGDRRQPCVVMIVGEGEETVRRGMSGGPVLDLDAQERGEVIVSMVTAAAWPGLLRQPTGEPEVLPVAEYAFGVVFSEVAQRYPEFVDVVGEAVAPASRGLG